MIKPNYWCALISAAGAGLALQAHAAEGFTLKGKPQIAIIAAAPRNDGGWVQSFDEARVRLEATLGTKIQLVESIPEDASSVKATVDKLVARGANIIIGTAFGYSDTFKEVAAQYPAVAFLNGSGTTNGPNLVSFYGRTYQSQYLCGMAAASVSKTGKLGFVAANPFGPVVWTVNAYELGAQKINPQATVTVIYTGAWNDPVKERAAAGALIDQGADVIGQHVDTPTVQIVAQERGKHGTGHHRDLSAFAPKATVCSSIWVWDKFLGPELKKIIAGGWKPSPYGAFVDMKDGGTDIPARLGAAIPADKLKLIMAEREAILHGKQIYAGPLADSTGRERVPAGGTLSDADLWKMDWVVKGVVTQK